LINAKRINTKSNASRMDGSIKERWMLCGPENMHVNVKRKGVLALLIPKPKI